MPNMSLPEQLSEIADCYPRIYRVFQDHSHLLFDSELTSVFSMLRKIDIVSTTKISVEDDFVDEEIDRAFSDLLDHFNDKNKMIRILSRVLFFFTEYQLLTRDLFLELISEKRISFWDCIYSIFFYSENLNNDVLLFSQSEKLSFFKANLDSFEEIIKALVKAKKFLDKEIFDYLKQIIMLPSNLMILNKVRDIVERHAAYGSISNVTINALHDLLLKTVSMEGWTVDSLIAALSEHYEYVRQFGFAELPPEERQQLFDRRSALNIFVSMGFDFEAITYIRELIGINDLAIVFDLLDNSIVSCIKRFVGSTNPTIVSQYMINIPVFFALRELKQSRYYQLIATDDFFAELSDFLRSNEVTEDGIVARISGAIESSKTLSFLSDEPEKLAWYAENSEDIYKIYLSGISLFDFNKLPMQFQQRLLRNITSDSGVSVLRVMRNYLDRKKFLLLVINCLEELSDFLHLTSLFCKQPQKEPLTTKLIFAIREIPNEALSIQAIKSVFTGFIDGMQAMNECFVSSAFYPLNPTQYRFINFLTICNFEHSDFHDFPESLKENIMHLPYEHIIFYLNFERTLNLVSKKLLGTSARPGGSYRAVIASIDKIVRELHSHAENSLSPDIQQWFSGFVKKYLEDARLSKKWNEVVPDEKTIIDLLENCFSHVQRYFYLSLKEEQRATFCNHKALIDQCCEQLRLPVSIFAPLLLQLSVDEKLEISDNYLNIFARFYRLLRESKAQINDVFLVNLFLHIAAITQVSNLLFLIEKYRLNFKTQLNFIIATLSVLANEAYSFEAVNLALSVCLLRVELFQLDNIHPVAAARMAIYPHKISLLVNVGFSVSQLAFLALQNVPFFEKAVSTIDLDCSLFLEEVLKHIHHKVRFFVVVLQTLDEIKNICAQLKELIKDGKNFYECAYEFASGIDLYVTDKPTACEFVSKFRADLVNESVSISQNTMRFSMLARPVVRRAEAENYAKKNPTSPTN